MARIARLVVPGIPHHVTQRGNRGETVFSTPSDYRAYLDILAPLAERSGLAIWAYCLMPSHVHLICVPAAEDSLRAAIAETHRRYTRRVNDREGWRGHLWQERFHSYPMDNAFLYEAVRYVELDAVRAGLVARARDWRWSSARARLSGRDDPLLSPAPPLEAFGDWRAYLRGGLDDETVETIELASRTGRPLGDAAFVARLEDIASRPLARRKPGPRKGAAPAR